MDGMNCEKSKSQKLFHHLQSLLAQESHDCLIEYREHSPESQP